jgi:hypothetical protein
MITESDIVNARNNAEPVTLINHYGLTLRAYLDGGYIIKYRYEFETCWCIKRAVEIFNGKKARILSKTNNKCKGNKNEK